jgi:hypothetical protein
MTPDRALVAYRYSLTDIDRWPDAVVHAFANHLRRTENER